jgi:glycosyltransferase involved in cell wall biosynthesis
MPLLTWQGTVGFQIGSDLALQEITRPCGGQSMKIRPGLEDNPNPATALPAARGARIVYLSYDGMCDPLGGSQVLPYLVGLAKRGHEISLVSFEKPERSNKEREEVADACHRAGISWHPLPYHKRPQVLSAMYDVRRMRRLAEQLRRERRFDLVHCRSYLPALVGLGMKRRHDVAFIFDMRGFWADERIDGRIWNLSNPVLRAVYNYFKRREAEFLAQADQIVSLTQAGEDILLARRPQTEVGPPITVIPCCVDFAAFPPVTTGDRATARHLLGIAPDARVVAYVGSIGTWYMLGEMLDFFRVQLERDPDALFLIVSREPADKIRAAAARRGVPADRLIIRAASREEVPKFVAAADYGLFFIKPVFSKKSSSPTKMAEFLALELPMVTNRGVGDVERIIAESGAGVVVDRFDEDAYRKALDELEALHPDMDHWRVAARRWFDLEQGIARYDSIYKAIVRDA